MQTIAIQILKACPNKCPGCFSYHSEEKMSFNAFKQIINKLPEDLKIINMTGGEPFLHPDLLKFCKYAKKRSKVGILTSGAVPLSNLNEFKDVVSMFFVNVKYPDENLDNNWKVNKNAHKNAVNLLKQCKKLKIPTTINFVIEKLNYPYLLRMVKFAKENGAYIDLIRFLPYTDEAREIYLKDKMWEAICSDVSKSELIRIAAPSRYSYQVCTGGVHRMYIQVSGEYTSCLYSQEVIGNILKDSWEEVEKKLEKWRLGYGDIKVCPAIIELKSKYVSPKQIDRLVEL